MIEERDGYMKQLRARIAWDRSWADLPKTSSYSRLLAS